MNEGVPFFVSLMAMTTHKTKGQKKLKKCWKTWSIGELQKKINKNKWGEEVGGLCLVQKQTGHWKIKPFCSFIFDQK